MRKRPGDNVTWKAVKLLVAPFMVVSIFILIWLRSGITSLEYRISSLEIEKLELLKRKKELIVRRSDILSIKNVEYIAMERLGLTFPDRKRVIYVKRGEQPYNFRADFRSHIE